MPEPIQTAVHGPYEDLAIALVGPIGKIVEGQPPEVRRQLWEMYLEDVKAWRQFWAGLK